MPTGPGNGCCHDVAVSEATQPAGDTSDRGDETAVAVRRRHLALRSGGPLWAWPLIGVALTAVSGQVAGRIGALLVAGMGLATFVLVGSELVFRGRNRLYAVGIAFAIAALLVLVALMQPVAGTDRSTSPAASASSTPNPPGPTPAPDLHGRTLTTSQLTRANLAGADLRGAHMQGVDLRGRELDGAVLAGAILVNSRLDGASLRGADLSGVDLRGACLHRTDLRGATMVGIDATGADVRNVLLSRGATDVVAHWPGPADGTPTSCT